MDEKKTTKAYALSEILTPLMGNVACGLFGISEDYQEAFASLDEGFITNRSATYFLSACGDSMAPFILHGDTIVVDRSVKIHSGKLVVCTLDGEFLCKRFIQNRSGGVMLCSENPKYKSIAITPEMDFLIFGSVIAIARPTK